MKKKLVFLVVLLVLFGLFVLFRYVILSQQDVYGGIRITSSPEASVFINNVAVGKTPYDDHKKKVGDYILKLIPDSTATDTASWQGKIQIYKNSLTYVNRELGTSDITSAGEIFTVTKMDKPPQNSGYGEISVDTEPQGAIVYLDNDEKGVAPLVLADVLRGDHELSVNLPGFLRRTEKANVNGGYRMNASFKLAIDQNQAGISPTPSQKSASTSAQTTEGKTLVVIKDTPTGFLRVRSEPSIDATESAQVKPGDSFDLLDEQDGWYKINYSATENGWVYSEYAEKKTQ